MCAKKDLYLFSLLLLLFFLPGQIFAQGAPAQKFVTVIVSPDRDSWKYQAKEEVTFTVQVLKNENLLKDVMVDYELGPEYFPVVTKKDILLEKG